MSRTKLPCVTICSRVWQCKGDIFHLDHETARWWQDKPELQLNYQSFAMDPEIQVPKEFDFTLPDNGDLHSVFGPMWIERNEIEIWDERGTVLDTFSLTDIADDNHTLIHKPLPDEDTTMLFRREEAKGTTIIDVVLQRPYDRQDFHFYVTQFEGQFGVITHLTYEYDNSTYRWIANDLRSVGSWCWI